MNSKNTIPGTALSRDAMKAIKGGSGTLTRFSCPVGNSTVFICINDGISDPLASCGYTNCSLDGLCSSATCNDPGGGA